MFKKFNEFINEELTKKEPHRVFCDLDGVLVDFERGFVELPENTEKLTPAEYEKKNGKNSIWKIIDKHGEDFWVNLYWTRDGRELWDYIKRYKPIILSAPSRHPGCIAGKTKWIKQNLGIKGEVVTKSEDFTSDSRIILDRLKYKYAKSANDILIDDTEEKLKGWTKHGGTGIHHDDSTDTVRVLDGILNPDSSSEDKIETKK